MKNLVVFVLVAFLMANCNEQVNKESKSETMIFPKGNRAPASNFTGVVWVHPLHADDTTFHCTMGSVTFEPGGRSNWHRHPSGQILVIISGTGYHQIKDQPIEILRKGDVVECPPDVEHWHGASPDSSMTHIAVNPNVERGVVTWLQPVTEEEYTKRDQSPKK